MKKQLNEFIAAVTAEDSTAFVQAVENHVTRKDGYDLEELLQSIPRKDLITICEGLQRQVDLGVDLFNADPEQPAQAPEDTLDGQDPDEEEPMTPQESGCEIMLGVSIISRLIFSVSKPSPPEALHDVAATLHDNALLAATEYPALQEEISKLCLEWWQAEIPGKERLTPQTLPYFLVSSLEQGTAAAVKRCHAMRKALELFDFEDPSIGDLKRLLLRAAFAPAFLRCTEGRRFLAFLFTLQPTFVRELTAIVKNQVPAGRRSVLDAYGEIIYRAWSMATGACLLEIKQYCIQGLMEAAILASTPALASSLRRVLAGLHCQKHQPGVDALLLELYEPILFRRLNAANPAVRRNALEILFDAFPLRDPEESNEATDARLTDQFAAMSAALKDDVPAVRAVAIAGVTNVLGAYWELIPGAVTAGYIKSLAGELAFDGSSPAVRAAVAEALTDLVDCPLAHPLLAVVLPKMAPQLYDASVKVRTAFMDLLLSLRGVKDLQWHRMVSVEKLLEVMAVDVPAVSGRIQQLLLPTYFPDAETGPALVAALLRTSPNAGKSFCLFLAGAYMPTLGGVAAAVTTPAGPAVAQHCLVALIKDLTTHLLEVPLAAEMSIGDGAKGTRKGRSKRKKSQKAALEKEEEEEEDVPVIESAESWEAILGGLLAAVCGFGAQISAGSLELSAVKGLFPGDTLSKLLDRCSTPEAREMVATIAAAVPAAPGAVDIRTACLTLLGEDSSDPAVGHEVRAALECVAAHPASRAVLVKALAEALGASAEEVLAAAEEEEEAGPQQVKKRKNEKYSMRNIDQAAAVKYLAALLELEGPRRYLLSSGVLGRLLPFVDGALGARVGDLTVALDNKSGAEELGTRPDARLAMLTYMKGSLHMVLAGQPGSKGGAALLEGQAGDSARSQAVECLQQAMQWATQLLQRLGPIEGDDLLAAIVPPAPHPQPSKRTKAAKGRAATPSIPVLSPEISAIKEAFTAVQTCVVLAGDAARLRALSQAGTAASWAPSAARVAQLFVTVIRNIATASKSAALGSDEADVVVLSGVSHVARLARNIASTLGSVPSDGARDLRSELAHAAAGAASPVGSDAGNPVGELAEALLGVLCEDKEGALVAAAKAHLAGLLAALCTDGAEREGGGGGILSGVWLTPVASLIASEIDIEDCVDNVPGAGGGENENEADENAQEAANKGGGSEKRSKNTALRVSSVVSSGQLLTEAMEVPIVKHLVAAAKLTKVNESAAGQAAALAARAWGRGDSVLALGGVELAQVLGFQGLTVRGKSKAGANTFVLTISELKKVHQAAEMSESGDRDEGTTGNGTGAAERAKVVLVEKLKALFPPAPRVSFDEMFTT